MAITVDRVDAEPAECVEPDWEFVRNPPPLIAQIAADGGPLLFPLNVDQFLASVRGGVFPERAQIELVDGLLFRKDRRDAEGDLMTEGERHYLAKNLLRQVLDSIVSPLGCHAVTEPPVHLSDFTLPEPDVGVFRGKLLDYRGRLPQAADAALLVEVAWSSLKYDRGIKLARYAAAGVPTYWIVSLSTATVEVYTRPEPAESRYAEKRTFDATASIPLTLFDKTTVEVPAAGFLPA